GGGGVAPALDVDAVEEGTVGYVVCGVDLGADHVARLELDQLVGTRPDGLHHADVLAGGLPLDRGEDVTRQQAVAGEDHGPEWLRLLEHDLDRMAIELVYPGHLFVRRAGAGAVGRIRRELPVEDHVVCRERRAVVPDDVLLQSPRDRLSVLPEAAVLERRDLLGEDGDERAVRGWRRQRLIEDAR